MERNVDRKTLLLMAVRMHLIDYYIYIWLICVDTCVCVLIPLAGETCCLLAAITEGYYWLILHTKLIREVPPHTKFSVVVLSSLHEKPLSMKLVRCLY